MLVTMACTVPLLLACTQEPSEARERSAREKFAAGDYKAAEVELRRILRKRPENSDVRLLLVEVLVSAGEFGAAVEQLKEVPQGAVLGARHLTLLSSSLLGVENYREVVTQLGAVNLEDPQANATVRSAVGEAYIALGRMQDAEGAFSAAIASVPGMHRARAGAARLVAMRGDLRSAERFADEILSEAPGSVQALALKADLLALRGEYPAATKVLQVLVKVAPFDAPSRYALLSMFATTNALDRMPGEIAVLKKLRPQDARWRYFEAVVALRRQEVQKAREAIRPVLVAMPNYGPALLLSGAIAFQAGDLPVAEKDLRRYLSLQPRNQVARGMLMQTYLRMGRTLQAEKIMGAAMKGAPSDPSVLRAMGELALANNSVGEATRFYEQALKQESDSVSMRTRLAQLRLIAGEDKKGLEELEATATLDATSYQADLSLVMAYLGRKEYDKALAVASELQKKLPGNALSHDVLGAVHVARKDPANARVSFERALGLQFNDIAAAQNLASLDIADGNTLSARRRFESILVREPANEGALLSLAQVQVSSHAAPAEVLATIERAVNSNPVSVSARIALINYRSRSDAPATALAAARDADRAIPDDSRIVEALGLAELAAGDIQRATDTFGRLVRLEPNSPMPYVRLATAQHAAGQSERAIKSLRDALVVAPRSPAIHNQIVQILVASDRMKEAFEQARGYQRSFPKDPAGYAMEGFVLAKSKSLGRAAESYREAMKRQAVPEFFVRWHQIARESGKTDEAAVVAAKWLTDNKEDAVARYYLADFAMQESRFRDAAILYQEILALRPSDPATLNNLAWVLGLISDPQALTIAEAAYKRSPADPKILDTYGWLLFGAGNTKRAIEMLTLAAKGSPESAAVHLRLGKVLLKAGNAGAARSAFESSAKIGKAKPEGDEAERLLKSL